MSKVGNPRVVTGTGQRLGLPMEVNSASRQNRVAKWKQEAWEYHDAIGEIKYGHSQLAEATGRVRLFIAHRPNPAEEPVDALVDGVAGAKEAVDALERLGQSDEGLPGLQRSYVINHQVAGDMYLVGEPLPDGSEEWSIRSVEEVIALEKKVRDPITGLMREQYGVREFPGADPRPLPIDTYTARLWSKHPRFSGESDSPMRSVREQCDELLILSRSIRGMARSAAVNGFTAFPQGMRMAVPDVKTDGSTEPQPEDFITEFGERMLQPILDESSPEAVLGVMIEGPGDKIAEIKHFPWNRAIDAVTANLRKELIHRIAMGLNFPVEIIEGMARLNHWTAAVVSQTLFDNHVEPIVVGMCNALMVGYIRPVIIEMGVDPIDARNLILWYDASSLISQPDEIADVAAAHGAYVVNDAYYRSVLNIGEENAPDDAEIAKRVKIAQEIKGGLPAVDAGTTAVAPPDVQGPTGSAVILATAAPKRSNRTPLGRRLADLDRSLRDRLEVAATAAMKRALEKAGGKLKRRAQKDAATASAIDGADWINVGSLLGPPLVAALGFTEPDLLDGEFDDFGSDFDTWTARTQKKARTMTADELNLDDPEDAEIAATQDRHRGEALAWLLPSLGALAAARLYDPTPSAPALGEHDSTLLVPPGMIREAMARAGGASGLTQNGEPAGGVATGATLTDLMSQHGRPIDGWEWSIGDPARPFDGHERLDGVSFVNWDDDVLAVQAGDEWIGDFYGIADHDGCQCVAIPSFAESEDSVNAGDAEAA